MESFTHSGNSIKPSAEHILIHVRLRVCGFSKRQMFLVAVNMHIEWMMPVAIDMPHMCMVYIFIYSYALSACPCPAHNAWKRVASHTHTHLTN